MATLYIDESGNTGPTSTKNSKFNFSDQPYFVLAGILLEKDQEEWLKDFINSEVSARKIQGGELKAKNLYDSHPDFLQSLFSKIIEHEIPFFVELMDKRYFLSIHIVNHFLFPFNLYPASPEALKVRVMLASQLSQILDDQVFHRLLHTVSAYTTDALENYYEFLDAYFHFQDNTPPICSKLVATVREEFTKSKKLDPANAFKDYLPVPDLNQKNRDIFMLPHYNAFSSLTARAQKKYDDLEKTTGITIIHDEQVHFDRILSDCLNLMKSIDFEAYGGITVHLEGVNYQIDPETQIQFINSKTNECTQVADVLAGFVMRFWSDYLNGNEPKHNKYKSLFQTLSNQHTKGSIGINFVVPTHDRERYWADKE